MQKLGYHLAPSDEGAGERSETEGEKKLSFLVALLLLSLRLLPRKIHLPRQREARIVLTPTFKIEPLKKADKSVLDLSALKL